MTAKQPSRIEAIRQIGVIEQTYSRGYIEASQRHWAQRDAEGVAEWAQNSVVTSQDSTDPGIGGDHADMLTETA